MPTIFELLKRHYKTHGRAAEAIGYSRQRYLHFRQGRPLPRRALQIILAVVAQIPGEQKEAQIMPKATTSQEQSASDSSESLGKA